MSFMILYTFSSRFLVINRVEVTNIILQRSSIHAQDPKLTQTGQSVYANYMVVCRHAFCALVLDYHCFRLEKDFPDPKRFSHENISCTEIFGYTGKRQKIHQMFHW